MTCQRGKDPGVGDREQVTDRYDTFHDWQWQLWRACLDDRLEDVEAIASLRPPEQVVLDHVTVLEERRPGLRSTRRESRLEPVPCRAMASTEAREKPGALPSVSATGAFRRRGHRRKLLRKPLEFQGPSPFWARSTRCLEILLAKGAKEGDRGWMGIPLVVHVAQRGDLAMLRFLIDERGGDANATRQDGGYSALHWAQGRAVVAYLVDRGADPFALTDFGDSVLAQQVRSEDVGAVEYLLGLGLENISVANAWHWITLNPALVRALLAGGISSDQPIPATFGERYDTLLLQKLIRMGIHDWMKAEGTARAAVGERLTACVRATLEHGFDGHRRDASQQLAYHVVEDHRDALDDVLCHELEALLRPFDGPRKAFPDLPACTCGLNF